MSKSWKDHLRDKSAYYKKKKENQDSQSSDLSKGIVYVPRQLLEAGEIFKFFLVPHITKKSLTMTRGIHWMGKGKPAVRCPIFCREDQEFIPNPEANENILDAIERAFRTKNGPRCAWCELKLAGTMTDNEKVLESAFPSNYKEDRSVSLRVDFFVLPYEKIFKDPPECFGDQPDWSDKECKECIFSGECFLGELRVNVLEKTQGVEQQIIRAIESIEDELQDDSDDILDLENAVLFKLERIEGKRTEYDVQTGTKRYNVAKQFEKATGKDIYEALEESWPDDELFFTPSHTYAEMVAGMKPVEKKCLLSYLAEEGREVPDIEDDEEEETPKKSRRSRSDDEEEETPKRKKKSRRKGDDDEEEERPKRNKSRRRDPEEEEELEEESEDEDDDSDEEEKPKKKFGRRRPPVEEEDEEEEDDKSTTRKMKFRRRR
jgi:hypothetical protein